MLCRYVAWLARTCQYCTICNYLQGVRVLYQQAGLANPLEGRFRLRMLLQGVRRTRSGPPAKKHPVTPDLLMRWGSLLDMRQPRAAALWACMLVAFFGMFRKVTVAVGRESLFDGDLALTRACITVDLAAYCMRIAVPKSKTNQYRERPDVVVIAGIPGSRLDPVAAYLAMLRLAPAAPGQPAFGCAQGGAYAPVTHAELVRAAKALVARCGLDPALYAGHSFRRGGATFAFSAGVPPALIKLQGLWASDVYLGYVDIPLDARARTTRMMAAAICKGTLHPAGGWQPPDGFFTATT